MVKLAGAFVVCAVAAFAVAFFAAGAGKTQVRHTPRAKILPFADTAASGVAGGFSGTLAALKLPPPPKPKPKPKHHAKPAVSVSATPVATAPSASVTPPVYTPPVHHKSRGTGTGVTTVGP